MGSSYVSNGIFLTSGSTSTLSPVKRVGLPGKVHYERGNYKFVEDISINSEVLDLGLVSQRNCRTAGVKSLISD